MAINLSVKEILVATEGQLLQGNDKTQIDGVGTDSRSDLSQKLFVALSGDNFDGHDFISPDLKVKAVLVHRQKDLAAYPRDASVILVKDTLKSLQSLAKYWRHKVPAKFLAISGSNGKTTSKEFAKSVLSSKYSVTASPASFNNHWGVPITLLSVSEQDDVAIIEMGMNHLGELKNLSQMTEQDVSVVTNIGRAHIGEVGSFEKVIEAKKELYDFSLQALHIFNLDNKETLKIFKLNQHKQAMTFSAFDQKADVFLEVKEIFLDKILVQGHIAGVGGESLISIFGRHNVYNVMVAACLGLSCGMTAQEVWSAFPRIQGAWGRSELKKSGQQGFKVIFDAYNANPESVNALIDSVSEVSLPGKKYFILGDMLELGDLSEKLHLEMMAKIMISYDGFWYVGQHMESIRALVAELKFEKTYFLSGTYEEVLAMKFHSMLNPEDLVLIKGSRGMQLESILGAWNIE